MTARGFIINGREPVRTCRGCGCDDHNACETDHGPCAWVLQDIHSPTGICSGCAVEVGWDPRAFLVMGSDLVREEEMSDAFFHEPGALRHG